MHKTYSLLILLFLLFSSNQAFAVCSSPAGTASQTRYGFAANKMYYCNDTSWIESGGGGGVAPINIFNGAVSPTGITVPGITYPAYYIIASSASGYQTSGGSDRTCSFRVKISGGWVTLATQSGGGNSYFVANIIQISATETFIQSAALSNKKYVGTWNGQMYVATASACPSVLTSVVRLN